MVVGVMAIAVTSTVLLLAPKQSLLASLTSTGSKPDVARTVTLRKGAIDRTIAATAYFQARDQVDVGAQISGQLKSVEVLPGDRVRKGQLIAVIDDTLALSRLAQTKATLESLRAQRLAKEAQIVLAGHQVERSSLLMERGVSSAATHQIAEATLATAVAERGALQAQERGIEAAIAQAETELTFARIHAPMDGTVVAVVARPGQTLNATQQAPTILRVADLASLYLVAQVSEADVLSVQAGMEAHFTLLGAQDKRWSGQVVRVLPSPTTTNNVVLYDVPIAVANPDDLFKLQMTAQVTLSAERLSCALKLPRGSLPRGFRLPGSLDLQVYDINGTPRVAQVAVAIMDDIEVGIDCAEAERAGLQDGDRVAPIGPTGRTTRESRS